MAKTTQMVLAAGITLLINLVIWFISFNLVGVPFERSLPIGLASYLSVVLFGIGLGQVLYLLPTAIYLIWQRQWIWLQGMMLGAAFTLLLNGLGWVLIATGR